MEAVQLAATQCVAPLLNAHQGQQLVYSFDNDAVHQGAMEELQQRGLITNSNRAPLPPNSPDMHKVVEHSIARLTSMVNSELAHTEDLVLPVEHWRSRLEQMFLTGITAASIRADVASLKATYQAIIDVAGSWPPRKYR